MKPFPKDFLWGASTAAYQVEGGLTTQWSEWEQLHADRLARESPKELDWLPRQEQLRSRLADPENYICGRGVEHYERYESDFDLLGELHMNAFRFGIEWARLEPQEGVWDEATVEHYRDYIASLQQRGIEPVLTLWHWTMPVWFTEKGGFESKSNVRYFTRYVQKVADEFGLDLRYVLTLNEPNVYTAFSYMTGEWPPQRKNVWQGLQVYRNLVCAHRQAYDILKRANPQLQVGVAAQLGDVRARNPRNPLNRLVVKLAAYAWNWWFLDRLRNRQDFIGLNYYFTEYRDWAGRIRNPKKPVSDLGWYMEPSGIQPLLERTWRRYGRAVLITENGLADEADTKRKWWLEETLRALSEAQQNGVELIGYLHWSLLDNFEWAYGWWPKFGLVAVDRSTMKRTIRPSAKWFAAQIEKARHG